MPRAGRYALTARVATVQEGQKFQLAANDAKAPVEIAVPYTIGLWQPTQPVEISLVNGKNVLHFALTGRQPRGDDQGVHADASETIRRKMNGSTAFKTILR